LINAFGVAFQRNDICSQPALFGSRLPQERADARDGGRGWGKIRDCSKKVTTIVARDRSMRRHHEELASIVPALSLLVPLAGALWVRIKTGCKKGGDQA
jgi:hypothetical protein